MIGNLFCKLFNKSISEFYIILKGNGTEHRIYTPDVKNIIKIWVKE